MTQHSPAKARIQIPDSCSCEPRSVQVTATSHARHFPARARPTWKYPGAALTDLLSWARHAAGKLGTQAHKNGPRPPASLDATGPRRWFKQAQNDKGPVSRAFVCTLNLVGGTGFEPVTPAV